LQLGIFTITPALGIILPNGYHVITIDCVPEIAGKFEEEICLDITDRDMNQYPNGIVYKLSCDAVFPTILHSNEIFEEHTIISNISSFDPKVVSQHEPHISFSFYF
jgi:hydrocephalus-inducing protein